MEDDSDFDVTRFLQNEVIVMPYILLRALESRWPLWSRCVRDRIRRIKVLECLSALTGPLEV